MNTLVRLLSAAAALFPAVLAANTAPTVVIQSASMRPGTTLMDVVYRVNDPDDATVKTRALAFIGGVRSFANLIKPVTFAEGTAAKLGDAILSNTNHTLTWDAAADWDIDLGQIKFEILAMDGRGLLPIDWITIPAAGGNPALTISKDTPADADVLNALFWQYADGDSGLTLSNGVLTGNASSGVFESEALATGTALSYYSNPYILKRLNLDPARASEVNYGSVSARAGLLATNKWHAANRSFSGISKVISSGGYNVITTIPTGLTDVISISAGMYISLALQSDGTVVAWGEPSISTVPEGLSGVTAISAGAAHGLALKQDGTVVGWGNNDNSGANIPNGLTDVVSISAGGNSMALRADGTVVTWGYTSEAAASLATPDGLSGVVAISAGSEHNMALKSNGTVVAWGSGPVNVPEGLNSVIAIAAGWSYSFALKSDGTVVGWGNQFIFPGSPPLIPDGLNGVVAISAGATHCLALKNDGTIVTIGSISNAAYYVPFQSNTNGVTAIDAGVWHNLILKPKAQ
jgi:hypothetical protein